MMSAPVNFVPQRYCPPPGEDASCSSRNLKCVLKFGVRKDSITLDAILPVIGLMKKGTGAFLISAL